MPEPITILGLAKTTTDLVKEATDLARATKNTDLAEKLIDVYRNVVELTDTNQQLRAQVQDQKNEIVELKRESDVRTKLKYDKDHSAYFLMQDDSTQDGPFCTVCWDVDGKLVRETPNSMGLIWCPYCASGVRRSKR